MLLTTNASMDADRRHVTGTAKSILLPTDRARELSLDLLRQLGVPEAEAVETTAALVEASLRGVDSHGIALLAVLAERIRSGQICPGRCVFVRREGATTAWVDGQHGLGPPLANQAVRMAAAKAAASGLGAVSLFDGNYVGALAPYVELPAADGLIAIAMANSTPRVAPHGGSAGLHGTNPIAFAAPGEGELLVFDAATGHAAARVVQAAEEGVDIAPGIALDASGRPTTDPAAAAAGTLLPVGGALGYGLGLLVDVLTGGLAAAPVGRAVPAVTALDGPYGCSFFVLVIDPRRFGGAAALCQRVTALAQMARITEPAQGAGSVRIPGDRARLTRQQRLDQGIPFTPRRWQALRERLQKMGLAVPDAASIALARE